MVGGLATSLVWQRTAVLSCLWCASCSSGSSASTNTPTTSAAASSSPAAPRVTIINRTGHTLDVQLGSSTTTLACDQSEGINIGDSVAEQLRIASHAGGHVYFEGVLPSGAAAMQISPGGVSVGPPGGGFGGAGPTCAD